MAYRTLDLTLISPSKVLTNTSIFNKHNHIYTVASISGTARKLDQKFKTTWNYPMKFTVNEAAGFQNPLTLVVKIKAARILFVDKNLGEVRVPIKELLEGVTTEGKMMQTVSYPVRGRSGEQKGVLSFSYKFGKLIISGEKSVTAYPPAKAAVSGKGPQSSSGMGFGTGLLGGMMVGAAANIGGVGGGGGGGDGGGGGCGGCS